MDFKKFLAALKVAVPAAGQIVTELHPENTAEGVKIAAGVQLFQILVAGIHAVAAAGEAPAGTAVPAVPTAPGAASPNVTA